MPGSSNNTAYNGRTPSKPQHRFSTTHAGDHQTHRAQRLADYRNAAHSTPRLAFADAAEAERSNRARVAAEMDRVMRPFR
ncbi:hypothetical protein F4780DRAFT_671631 [Xylariomycetidae sp. FL0641]|nr:hypothetical protein F4780DRAFT_671631 [Xylariomycetidae sp. FL0641]